MNDQPNQNSFAAPSGSERVTRHSSSSQKHHQLSLSLAEAASGIGAICFLVSLALPSIKHGQDQLGINCFTLSLFGIFGSSPSPQANELQLMSIASHVMHASVFTSFVMIWFRKSNLSILKAACAIVATASAIFVLTVPYSGIETVFLGFYLWIGSLMLICAAQFLPNSNSSAG